ncbi:MAG: hypothetical protein FJZ90_06210 [Chloroflexi bacterium]|nr:hypothetical protein [Chloroflexota bacterium]
MHRVKRFSNRFLTSLLILMLGALAFALPASADSLGQALPFGQLEIKGPLSLELIVAEDGSWVANATLEGAQLRTSATSAAALKLDKIELADQSPESLRETFLQLGMDLMVPPLEPALVSQMVSLGVQQAAIQALSKEGYQEVSAYINNQLLLTIDISDSMLDTAIKTAGVPEEQMGIVQIARDMDAVVVVLHFPKGGGEAATFADQLTPVTSTPLNVIELGATMAPVAGGTKIVSLGGISAGEIEGVIQQMMPGALLPQLATTAFADFGIKEAHATLGANGLEIDAGDGRWIKVLWDKESRGVLYKYLPAVTQMVGMALPIDLGMLPMIEDLLATSQVHAVIYVADAAKEGLPKIQFGRPILVEIADDGVMTIGGQPVGAMALGPLAGYMPVAVKVDGAAMEIRPVIKGGVQMPYVFIAKGGLAQVGDKLLAVDLPWDKVEGIVEGLSLSAFVMPKGQAVPSVNLDYQAQTVDMLLPRIVPRVAVDSKGHVGVGEPPLRVSGFAEEFGVPLEQMVWPWVAAYGKPGDMVSLVVDNNAIEIGMNGKAVGGIKWDPALRANVVGLFAIPELPFGIESTFPDWKAQLTELLVRAEWGVELKVVEEEIPPSGFEGYVKDIRGYLPF